MSVRATQSLIADLVTVTGISGSPRMVVLSVDEQAKQVTTVWFSSSGKSQQAVFPAQALDRVEVKTSAPAKKSSAGKTSKKK